MHYRKKNNPQSTLIKSGLISSILITANILWYILFYSDKSLSLTFGILCPIIYGVFYLLIKKFRKKNRSKIRSFIYIPIAYTFFGIIWLSFSLGISKLSNMSSDSPISNDVNVIEKLEIKNFFLFNPNLSFPSKISEEIERKIWYKNAYQQIVQSSKKQTNNLILFILLFFIQMLVIYIVENTIYPRIKPEKKKKYKHTSRRPPRDTIISNEKDIFLNFSELKEEEVELPKENKSQFPKL